MPLAFDLTIVNDAFVSESCHGDATTDVRAQLARRARSGDSRHSARRHDDDATSLFNKQGNSLQISYAVT